MIRHLRIAVCGNIGVGKSTLCTDLVRKLSAKYIFENYANNPYLEPFYQDLKDNVLPNRYALNTELFFLEDLFTQHSAEYEETYVVFDRTLYETCWVFCESLIAAGIIGKEDAEIVRKKAAEYVSKFQGYDAYIYLRANTKTLMERIASRGREMEKDIKESYLQELEALYEKMFSEKIDPLKTIIIDTDQMKQDEVLETTISELERVINFQ